MLTNLLNEESMVRIAWAQAILSLPSLVIFNFLNTEWRIWLLGIVTMITWTGTALAHISAARANREIVAQNADVDIETDSVTIN